MHKVSRDIPDERILRACSEGHANIIRNYISSGHSFNFIEESTGRTPLMLAAANTSNEIFKSVLKHTSPDYLHKLDNEGRNALFYACLSNSLFRVKILFEDKQVKVTRASDGSFPSQQSNNPSIVKLLQPQTESILDIHGAILKDAFDKYGKDKEALKADVYRRTGQRIIITPAPEYLARPGTPVMVTSDEIKQFVIDNPLVQEEIKKDFTDNPPQSVTSAIKGLRDQYGVTLAKEEIIDTLDNIGIQPRKEVLKDKEVRKSIARYFMSNKPKNLEEAQKYIQDTYHYTYHAEQLIPFLKYCGVTFDNVENP